jgi:hypothetical protein
MAAPRGITGGPGKGQYVPVSLTKPIRSRGLVIVLTGLIAIPASVLLLAVSFVQFWHFDPVTTEVNAPELTLAFGGGFGLLGAAILVAWLRTAWRYLRNRQ